jgi:outer membrane protein insertion porin family
MNLPFGFVESFSLCPLCNWLTIMIQAFRMRCFRVIPSFQTEGLQAEGLQKVYGLLLVLVCAGMTLGCFSAEAQESGNVTKKGLLDTPKRPTGIETFAPELVDAKGAGSAYDQGVQVYKIVFQGLRLVKEPTVLAAMTLQPGAVYNRNDLLKDLKRIYELGYFSESMKATPIATSQGVVIQITLQENTPVVAVNPKGYEALTTAEVLACFQDQVGMPQNLKLLNQGIETLRKTYEDKGYILAQVTGVQDQPDGTLDVLIDEGRIGKILFVGNRKTKDQVIRRELSLKEGGLYNEKTLTDDLKRLYGMQFFSDVRRGIAASPDTPGRYDVTIEVDEKRTAALSLGGGVDTITGFFGSAGYNDPNFRGEGENLNLLFSIGSGILLRDNRTQTSGQIYQFEANWSTISVKETDNALSFGGYGRFSPSFNVPLSSERRFGVETTWSRPIHSLPNTSFALNLKGEQVNLREGDFERLNRLYGITQAQRDTMLEKGFFLMASPTLAFDTRDNRFDPSNGWFNSIGATGALGMSGLDSYASLTGNLRYYKALTPWLTLALNGQAASSVFGDIPDFNAFRLGGAWSVRGYQEGGLGVGSGLLLGTAELRSKVPFLAPVAKRIKFLDSLRLAVFTDAGTLLNESEWNRFYGRLGSGYSVGAGVRVTIPGVGPLRVDYAVPLRNAQDGNRRFSFGVGQKF